MGTALASDLGNRAVSSESTPARVLVVDDEPGVRAVVAEGLSAQGFDVTVAADADDALEAMSIHRFDVVLTDLTMPGLSGVGVVEAIRQADPDVEVLVMTGDATVETAVAAVKCGAYDYIEKPIRVVGLAATIKRAMEAGSLRGMVGLFEISREIHGDLYTSDLASRLLHLAGRVFRDVDIRLALQTGTEEDLEVRPAQTARPGPAPAIVCEVSRTALRQRIALRDTIADRNSAHGLVPDGFRSILVFPLVGRDEALGALSFWRRIGQPSFSITEFRRGMVVAAEMALALDNARLYGTLQDKVNELIDARDQLVQAEKQAAIGRLAAGVAHEINTPTQFVGDSIHFLGDAFSDLVALVGGYRKAVESSTTAAADPQLIGQLRCAEETADLEYLTQQIPLAIERSLEGTARVANIVRAMKDFAHPDRKEKTPADLNRALLGTLTVAHNELKYVAEVETDFGDLPQVTCHIGDLNQVFLNLLVNAAHAIEAAVGESGRKGKITVRTRFSGDQVTVEISDTGCGIPPENRERVFEPFFTTKEVGRGTGQGLAIARNIIVERHGGTITLDSRTGRGTTFYVGLPVSGVLP